jgi:hypothetical protein
MNGAPVLLWLVRGDNGNGPIEITVLWWETQKQIPFGNDKQKTRATTTALWLGNGLHPTHRDETAMNGAPVLLWL